MPTHLRVEGRRDDSHGPEVKLPKVYVGTVDKEPAEWAERLMALPYTNSRQGNVPTTIALSTLVRMTPQRELRLRPDCRWTADAFNTSLANNRSAVEACLGYVVGVEAPTPCSYCLRNLRSFPVCIIIPDCPQLTACMGCHQNDKDRQCDHYVPPEEAPAAPDPDVFDKLKEVLATTIQTQQDLNTKLLQQLDSWNKARSDFSAMMVAQNDAKGHLSRRANKRFEAAIKECQEAKVDAESVGRNLERQSSLVESALKERAELAARRAARHERPQPRPGFNI
ncbi:hypothetical protein N7456_006771 [Penicillium angulare]|uniref:Uncharacterized protein n=1 Tax=Penicillium angulare TaxID=116970 RepID=A0A9W9FIE7_9EURO|nr:hypothetical protein N7456_006771 [Penicillium angulare]